MPRGGVRAAADPHAASASWDAIVDRIDRPRATPFEWAADRLGLPTATTRGGPDSRAATRNSCRGVAVLAALAVLASRAADSAGPFLVIAPVVPLATVGLLATRVTDPAGEVGVSTPMHGFMLVLRRSVVTLLLTLVVLGAASIALPGVGAVTLGWLLPSLALSATAVLLSSWLRPEITVAALGFGWITLLTVSAVVERRGIPVRDWLMFHRGGLTAWLALAVFASALIAARRDRFATLEVYR